MVWVVSLTILQGVCGMAFGLLVSALCDNEQEVERWCGEPLRAVLLPTAIFMTNKKGGARSC